MSALSPLRRIALLCAMLLALTPPPSAHAEAPTYWPYQTLTRGAASRDDLHVNGRGPSIVVLRDAEALRAFWDAAHRYHDTHVDVDVSVRPPNVDFERRMAVAVIGRSGSDTVHVQKMWTLPQEVLVAGLFNGRWPDIPTSPDRVPYELIVMPRTTRKLVTFERPTAVR
ncbi:MAG: hypothetical protein EB084_21210, partial [Proteobacteria bacterium]|nr:hypothetical protein [Pseudomonadota bacterium]